MPREGPSPRDTRSASGGSANSVIPNSTPRPTLTAAVADSTRSMSRKLCRTMPIITQSGSRPMPLIERASTEPASGRTRGEDLGQARDDEGEVDAEEDPLEAAPRLRVGVAVGAAQHEDRAHEEGRDEQSQAEGARARRERNAVEATHVEHREQREDPREVARQASSRASRIEAHEAEQRERRQGRERERVDGEGCGVLDAAAGEEAGHEEAGEQVGVGEQDAAPARRRAPRTGPPRSRRRRRWRRAAARGASAKRGARGSSWRSPARSTDHRRGLRAGRQGRERRLPVPGLPADLAPGDAFEPVSGLDAVRGGDGPHGEDDRSAGALGVPRHHEGRGRRLAEDVVEAETEAHQPDGEQRSENDSIGSSHASSTPWGSREPNALSDSSPCEVAHRAARPSSGRRLSSPPMRSASPSPSSSTVSMSSACAPWRKRASRPAGASACLTRQSSAPSRGESASVAGSSGSSRASESAMRPLAASNAAHEEGGLLHLDLAAEVAQRDDELPLGRQVPHAAVEVLAQPPVQDRLALVAPAPVVVEHETERPERRTGSGFARLPRGEASRGLAARADDALGLTSASQQPLRRQSRARRHASGSFSGSARPSAWRRQAPRKS